MVREVKSHQKAAHAPDTIQKIRALRASLGGRRVNNYRLTFRLLDAHKPSPTVTASGFRDLVHPAQDRFLTVREMARLQTFPDAWEFTGHRLDSYSTKRGVPLCQIAQVGNAVPPRLAEVLARSIKRQLFGDLGRFVDLGRGRMIPTVVGRLNEVYPPDRLGNKRNPVDELIYIVLSLRTREEQYQKGYRILRSRYRSWGQILEAPAGDLERILRPLGLFAQKANHLRTALERIRKDFGRITLDKLRGWDVSRALNYLMGFRGVNEKSAKCILLYSFDKKVLPVDTHTLRISKRLGFVRSRVSEYLAARPLETVVPPELRFDYHVRFVQHGRAICLPRSPMCDSCVIRSFCLFCGAR